MSHYAWLKSYRDPWISYPHSLAIILATCTFWRKFSQEKLIYMPHVNMCLCIHLQILQHMHTHVTHILTNTHTHYHATHDRMGCAWQSGLCIRRKDRSRYLITLELFLHHKPNTHRGVFSRRAVRVWERKKVYFFYLINLCTPCWFRMSPISWFPFLFCCCFNCVRGKGCVSVELQLNSVDTLIHWV